MCCELRLAPVIRDETEWQATHRVGVPLNTPPVWQLSQLASEWAPLSGKPVEKWSKPDLTAAAWPTIGAVAEINTNNAYSNFQNICMGLTGIVFIRCVINSYFEP